MVTTTPMPSSSNPVRWLQRPGCYVGCWWFWCLFCLLLFFVVPFFFFFFVGGVGGFEALGLGVWAFGFGGLGVGGLGVGGSGSGSFSCVALPS